MNAEQFDRAPVEEAHVLIVDDDRDFVAGLVDILEPRQYQVATAHDRASARAALKASDADVALIDVRLGTESGLDLLTELKQIHPGLLCVVMSAFTDMDAAIRAVREGAFDCLRKPIAGDALLTTLVRCFRTVQLQREKAAAEQGLWEREELLESFFCQSEEVFQDVVTLIPPGWHYPEMTRARICFEGKEFVSEPFAETEWKQTSDIVAHGEV